jgi:hypothetical protein
MFAKIAIAVAVFIALAPHILSLKYRLVAIGVTVGITSGVLGTAARIEPASMIPVNFGGGILAGVVVAAVLHFATEAVMNFRKAP